MVSKDIQFVGQLLNDAFLYSESLILYFGGKDGPFYESEKSTIFIPYSFVQEVQGRFKEAQYDKKGVTVEELATDALIHTLFHELAHALIAMYDLPVSGQEEDAADTFATLQLIEFYENGQNAV